MFQSQPPLMTAEIENDTVTPESETGQRAQHSLFPGVRPFYFRSWAGPGNFSVKSGLKVKKQKYLLLRLSVTADTMAFMYFIHH